MSGIISLSLDILQKPEIPSTSTPFFRSSSQIRLTPMESEAMWPEMTTLRWHSLQTLRDDSGMCMTISVPMPAFTSSG